jgi:hypothetical protein
MSKPEADAVYLPMGVLRAAGSGGIISRYLFHCPVQIEEAKRKEGFSHEYAEWAYNGNPTATGDGERIQENR